LGIGINRSNYAQGIFGAYQSRVIADGGVTEAGACVDAVSGLLQTASLLLIPSGYKSGKAYAQIPTNGNGDLTWTRASTALRTNSSGLLESMGSGVPRLSYMYGSCPALLLEPQRTNLALRSEEFDSVSWTKSNSSVTANTTTSPDGNTTADSLIENTSSGLHFVSQTAGIGGTYTLSFYVKANTRNWVYITMFDGIADRGAFFNVSTGVVGNIDSGVTASIQSVGNGWYRCIVTATNLAAFSSSCQLATANGTRSYTGNGTSGLFIWGVQLELGAYPTTYIPTTTASATRVADSFSRNNIYTNGLITSSGGTWFVELRGNLALGRDSSNVSLYLGDNLTPTNGNGFYLVNGGGTDRLTIWKRVSGSGGFLYTTITSTVKMAIKWNGSTADVFVNGTKVVSASSFTTTLMEYLYSASGGPCQTEFIQAMALYPTPLSDTDCTTLTTL
jgi:hypothetical protein